MEYASQSLIPGTEIFKTLKRREEKRKHNLEFPCVYTVCNFPLSQEADLFKE